MKGNDFDLHIFPSLTANIPDSSGSLSRMILYPALLSIFPDNRSCLRFLTMYVLVVIGLSSPVRSLA